MTGFFTDLSQLAASTTHFLPPARPLHRSDDTPTSRASFSQGHG
jgi:hypothetical protein